MRIAVSPKGAQDMTVPASDRNVKDVCPDCGLFTANCTCPHTLRDGEPKPATITLHCPDKRGNGKIVAFEAPDIRPARDFPATWGVDRPDSEEYIQWALDNLQHSLAFRDWQRLLDNGYRQMRNHQQDECRAAAWAMCKSCGDTGHQWDIGNGGLEAGRCPCRPADTRPTVAQIVAALRTFATRHKTLPPQSRVFMGRYGLPPGWHLRAHNGTLELVVGFNSKQSAIVGRVLPHTGNEFAFCRLDHAVRELAAEPVEAEAITF